MLVYSPQKDKFFPSSGVILYPRQGHAVVRFALRAVRLRRWCYLRECTGCSDGLAGLDTAISSLSHSPPFSLTSFPATTTFTVGTILTFSPSRNPRPTASLSPHLFLAHSTRFQKQSSSFQSITNQPIYQFLSAKAKGKGKCNGSTTSLISRTLMSGGEPRQSPPDLQRSLKFCISFHPHHAKKNGKKM